MLSQEWTKTKQKIESIVLLLDYIHWKNEIRRGEAVFAEAFVCVVTLLMTSNSDNEYE